MAKKSKLLLALDAHKGRNYELERQKKLQKAAEKKKKAKSGNEEDVAADNIEAEEEDQNEEAEEAEAAEQSDAAENEHNDEEEEDEEEDEDEDEEDIPLSELDEEDTTDVIPHQRLTINNSAAIRTSLKRISFITPQTDFSEHQSLTCTEKFDVPDPNDDLTRELAFYKTCVSAAKDARSLLKKEGIPFSRPTDYFAEMVKSDEHMGKVKKKLYDEAAAKKASAEAKRQRDLKKFGKQVQIAKQQQRQKEKRETLEKINTLKRKRQAGGTTGPTDNNDLFDIALEDANKPEPRSGATGGRGPKGGAGGASTKRQKKDQKFGFGGKKRFAKSGDAVSSGDMRGFSVGKMKAQKKGGASKRLGKSRRAARK